MEACEERDLGTVLYDATPMPGPMMRANMYNMLEEKGITYYRKGGWV